MIHDDKLEGFTFIKPFKPLKPDNSLSSQVKVDFIYQKANKYCLSKYSLILQIGKEIAKQVDLKPRDKIILNADSENKQRLVVLKSGAGSRLMKYGSSALVAFVNLDTKSFLLKKEDMKERTVQYEILDKMLFLYLSKSV